MIHLEQNNNKPNPPEEITHRSPEFCSNCRKIYLSKTRNLKKSLNKALLENKRLQIKLSLFEDKEKSAGTVAFAKDGTGNSGSDKPLSQKEEKELFKIDEKQKLKSFDFLAENESVEYKELDNNTHEEIKIPQKCARNHERTISVVRNLIETFNLDKLTFKAYPIEKIICFKIRGVSSSVRSARFDLEKFCRIRFVSLRRFLIFPSSICRKIDLKEIENVGKIDCIRKCTAKLNKKPTNEVQVEEGEEQLSEIELFGFPAACDLAEERVVSIAKECLDEFDAIFEFKTGTIPDSLTSKIKKSTRCSLTYRENGKENKKSEIKLFAGSKTSLLDAMQILKKSSSKGLDKGKMEANRSLVQNIDTSPNDFSSVLSNKLLHELLRLSLEQDPPGFKNFPLKSSISFKFKKCGVELYTLKNINVELVEEVSNVLENILNSNYESVEIKSEIAKLLSRNIQTWKSEKKALVVMSKVRRKTELLKLNIFGIRKELAHFVKKAILHMIPSYTAKTYSVKKFKLTVFDEKTKEKLENKFGVIITVDKRKTNGGSDRASDIIVHSVSDTGDQREAVEKCEMVFKEMDKLFKKGDQMLSLEVPRARLVMLTEPVISKVEEKYGVKVNRVPQKSTGHYNEIFTLYGDSDSCRKAKRMIEKKSLLSIKPNLVIELNPNIVNCLFAQAGGAADKISEETGCYLFLQISKTGSAEVHVYGNDHACQSAAERIEKIGTNLRTPLLRIMVPRTDIDLMTERKGFHLKQLESQTGCEISIPSVFMRDPLDKEVEISVHGPEWANLGNVEKGIRKLTSLLSKVENRITRVVEVTDKVVEMLEGNEGKTMFLIQDETRCQLSVREGNQGDKFLLLRGNQAACDAAEGRINQICS